MTAKQLDNYLRRQGSPLAGHGKTFVQAGRRYRVNPRLLVAITGAESQLGKVLSGSHNPFGWGPGIDFPDFETAIDTVARGLRNGYLNEGLRTVDQISRKWAPVGAKNDPTNLNRHWVKNVNAFLRELGGGQPALAGNDTVPKPKPNLLEPPPEIVAPDLPPIVSESLARTASGRKSDPLALSLELAMAKRDAELATPPPPPAQPQAKVKPPPTGAGKDWRSWVKVPPARGSSSAPHQPAILQFVATIAQAADEPLEVWDNTTHSRLTVNGKVSDHHRGMAADIPARGKRLRRLGYLALLAAGMPDKQAREAARKGGLFNVGGYQIIFATQIGGDHSDHLHVGKRRR